MNNVTELRGRADELFDPARLELFDAVPPGLIQWIIAVDRLNPEEHGIGVLQIDRIEAFCFFEEGGFSSASFVTLLRDGRRFHLQCAIDPDNESDLVAVTAEQMPPDQELPFPECPKDPTTHWSDEIEAMNFDLARIKAGRTA